MTGPLVAFPEIVRLTLRQQLGRRRTLLLVLLAALPPLLALVYRAFGEVDVSGFTDSVFEPVSLTIVLPLATVLFGTGAFGAENDEGTILYLLAKPISRWVIVAAKAFAAVALSLVLRSPPSWLRARSRSCPPAPTASPQPRHMSGRWSSARCAMSRSS